jgi:hypothetical protein
MAEDGHYKANSWRWSPIKALRKQLKKPAGSWGAVLLGGIISAVLFTSLGATVGLTLKAFDVVDLGAEWPSWLVAALLALALGFGAGLGTLVARGWVFGPKVASLQSQIDELEPHRDSGLRVASYAEYLRVVLEHGLGDADFDVDAELLTRSAELIERSIGTKLYLSLWEPVLEGGGDTRWRLTHRRDHTNGECDAMEIRLKDSWIAHMQELGGDEPVFHIVDLSIDRSPGKDRSTFRRLGFKSLMCHRAGTGPTEAQHLPCLVVLSKEARVFSEVDYHFLHFVGSFLGLHREIATLKQQLAG